MDIPCVGRTTCRKSVERSRLERLWEGLKRELILRFRIDDCLCRVLEGWWLEMEMEGYWIDFF